MLNYGTAIAASGALANAARMDVMSNNLANVNTVGFKPQQITLRQRDPVRIEDNLPFIDSNKLIERLGAGVQPTMTYTSTGQGPIEETGDPFDLAIKGDGFFTMGPNRPGGSMTLTRDGRMTVATDGRLVHSTSGVPVLDEQGQFITLDPASTIHVRNDGVILQNDAPVARLGFLEVDSTDQLVKLGDGLLRPTEQMLENARPATGYIEQGFVEKSGVNPISTMMGVTSAARSSQSSISVIASIDTTVEAAISRLGRVS